MSNKKLFINYGFNTETEIFPDMKRAVENALVDHDDDNDECLYLNHYVDSDNGLSGWEAFLSRSYSDGIMIDDIPAFVENGISEDWWESEWDTEAEIHTEEEE